jgi:hypothetical protein
MSSKKQHSENENAETTDKGIDRRAFRGRSAAVGAFAFRTTQALAPNDEKIAGVDHSPGYPRAAAKRLAGG